MVAHGFRKIHSLRHGDGDRCRLEMPTSASWLGAQTPSYAFGHSIGHRDLLTDNTSTRWAELWRPQGRSLRWMDGRGIIARSRTPVDHLKLFNILGNCTCNGNGAWVGVAGHVRACGAAARASRLRAPRGGPSARAAHPRPSCRLAHAWQGYGSLPLHLAAGYSESVAVVEAVLRANPQAAEAKTKVRRPCRRARVRGRVTSRRCGGRGLAR